MWWLLPKRLRWFLHRRPDLAGEAGKILAREIDLHYRGRKGPDAPAQVQFIQRFGSSLNLHLHIHAVVSDGAFRKESGLLGGERLIFERGSEPSAGELAAMVESVRRKTLRRFVRLGAIPAETARELRSWEHSGFSLHAATAVKQGDRAGLERLLYYCARPALAATRLTYAKDKDLALYEARDKRSGAKTMVFTPLEFLGRVARLIPPARKNVVRYYGALGPNSPLRPLIVAEAVRCSGKSQPGLLGAVLKQAGEAVSASARAWAVCLSRVFEVDPLICGNCGGRLEPVAVIVEEAELVRLLGHLGLSTGYPKTAPARSPPKERNVDSQEDPEWGLYMGIDDLPAEDSAA